MGIDKLQFCDKIKSKGGDMGFFDKLVDKFIEVKREETKQNTYKMPKRIDFDKFYTNYEKVYKQICNVQAKISKENKKMLKSPELEVLADVEYEKTEYNQQQILKYSNSKQFSICLAQAIRFLRTYGLYFINQFEELDDNRRNQICDKLVGLYDVIIFIVLRYYSFDCAVGVTWDMKEQMFYHPKDMDNNVLKMVIAILDANTHLFKAVHKCDKKAAVNVMHKELLYIEDVYANVNCNDIEDIFEL